MDMIDLRSDTVTWPTPQMREAMATADVGDDVFSDDPTINQLEADAAEMLGKEAAVLVTSGTQGNMSAIMAHCPRATEVILGKEAHTFMSEAGNIAALGGIMPNTVPVQPDGTLLLDDIRAAIRQDNEHYPRTTLICLENTQARTGGNPLSVEYTNQVAAIAREHGLKLHIDGARLFNAATALGVPAKELVAEADSVTFCLSKGLCAPVGSVLAGSQSFITEARRARKIMGGGMRQAGILAAAGLISIHEMTKRLGDDHANARLLAEGLATIPCIDLDLDRVKTNFVFFSLNDESPMRGSELRDRLKADYHILVNPYGSDSRFRCLTHYWITRDRVETVIKAMQDLLT